MLPKENRKEKKASKSLFLVREVKMHFSFRLGNQCYNKPQKQFKYYLVIKL